MTMAEYELKGKLVLVTGAASGIGRAVAELFAFEQAQVIAVDIKQPNMTLTSFHLQMECDVSDPETVDKLAAEILSKYKRFPDGVVHCAGVLGDIGGMDGCSEQVYDKVMTVNMKGTYLINRKFATFMKAHGIQGSIVNISSIAVNGSSLCPSYACSKAAQVGWTKSLAKELAPLGIRCNTVHPGNIDTPIGTNSGISQDSLNARELRPHIPLGRLGTPKEVAQVCLFLISDRASYVTGSSYEVHGGAQVNG